MKKNPGVRWHHIWILSNIWRARDLQKFPRNIPKSLHGVRNYSPTRANEASRGEEILRDLGSWIQHRIQRLLYDVRWWSGACMGGSTHRSQSGQRSPRSACITGKSSASVHAVKPELWVKGFNVLPTKGKILNLKFYTLTPHQQLRAHSAVVFSRSAEGQDNWANKGSTGFLGWYGEDYQEDWKDLTYLVCSFKQNPLVSHRKNWLWGQDQYIRINCISTHEKWSLWK